MGNNAANVSVGKPKVGGAIFTAPLGTTLPIDAESELPASWTALGYCSEDGVKNSNDTSSEEITAWGGDKVLVVRTSFSETYAFTLIESKSVDVLKTAYGDKNVIGNLEDGIVIKHSGDNLDSKSWVVDTVLTPEEDGKAVLKRIVVPSGRVSGVGDVNYSDSDAIGYETIVSASADSGGGTSYEYIIKESGGSESENIEDGEDLDPPENIGDEED